MPQIEQYIPDGKSEYFIFGNDKPLSYQQIRRMRSRIKADIAFDEDIVPRRFRTTVLTDLYDETKDIKQTQAAAGHSTADMTLKHYVKGRQQNGDTATPVASRLRPDRVKPKCAVFFAGTYIEGNLKMCRKQNLRHMRS